MCSCVGGGDGGGGGGSGGGGGGDGRGGGYWAGKERIGRREWRDDRVMSKGYLGGVGKRGERKGIVNAPPPPPSPLLPPLLPPP